MYNKTSWVNRTAPYLEALNLNHMEKGIFDNSNAIDAIGLGETAKGEWTPIAGTEYPTSPTLGDSYFVAGLSTPYTFAGGDLAGRETDNQDKIYFSDAGWILVEQRNIPTDIAKYVDTIADLSGVATNTYTVTIVKEDGRGGIFVYDASKSGINDGGVIFNGWVRQYSGNIIEAEWFGIKYNTDTHDNDNIMRSLFQYTNGGKPIVSESTTYSQAEIDGFVSDYTNITIRLNGTVHHNEMLIVHTNVPIIGNSYGALWKNDVNVGFKYTGSGDIAVNDGLFVKSSGVFHIASTEADLKAIADTFDVNDRYKDTTDGTVLRAKGINKNITYSSSCKVGIVIRGHGGNFNNCSFGAVGHNPDVAMFAFNTWETIFIKNHYYPVKQSVVIVNTNSTSVRKNEMYTQLGGAVDDSLSFYPSGTSITDIDKATMLVYIIGSSLYIDGFATGGSAGAIALGFIADKSSRLRLVNSYFEISSPSNIWQHQIVILNASEVSHESGFIGRSNLSSSSVYLFENTTRQQMITGEMNTDGGAGALFETVNSDDIYITAKKYNYLHPLTINSWDNVSNVVVNKKNNLTITYEDGVDTTLTASTISIAIAKCGVFGTEKIKCDSDIADIADNKISVADISPRINKLILYSSVSGFTLLNNMFSGTMYKDLFLAFDNFNLPSSYLVTAAPNKGEHLEIGVNKGVFNSSCAVYRKIYASDGRGRLDIVIGDTVTKAPSVSYLVGANAQTSFSGGLVLDGVDAEWDDSLIYNITGMTISVSP